MVQDEEPVAAAVEVELVRAAGAPQRGDLALGSEPVEYLWDGRVGRRVCCWHGSNLLRPGNGNRDAYLVQLTALVLCVPERGTIDKAFDRHRRHARSRLQPE